ncbi:YqhA family protein [Aeromonas veronii]|uniref:YqhA family protein n=1 Tax=Aeromonas veronii TaxID=654 RepID=UPI002B48783E|nr:YqhA family protein [Aeromonas veronii]
MRRFNFMLNGSRLMMFPFYIGILICVVLLMVKFAMQLYQLSVNIFEIPYLDLITGVLILVAICGYVQFIQTEEQRASLSSNWLSKINFASLKLIVINSLVTIAGVEVLKAFLEDGIINEVDMKWSVVVFLAFSLAALIYAVTERMAEHK